MELSFKTEQLKEAWNEWLQERKERKLRKFTERGMKAAITHLLNISGHNEETAVQIINQSIAQGWQGLFPLKNLSNGTAHQQPSNNNLGKSAGFSRLVELAKGANPRTATGN